MTATTRTEEWSKAIIRPTGSALLVWAFLVLVGQVAPGLYPQAKALFDALRHNDLMIATWLLCIAGVLLIAEPMYRLLLRWLRRSRWLNGDSFLVIGTLIGFLLLLLEAIYRRQLLNTRWTQIVVAAMGLAACVRGIAILLVRSRVAAPSQPPNSLFDRIFEEFSLVPIQSEKEDELERLPLLEELYALVSRSREVSLNFAIEGAWGSGKTSLLNLLRHRLETDGYTVVTLDLWNYRDPARLIRVYFDKLASGLANYAPHLQSRKLFHRLAAGLIELGGGSFARASQAVFGDLLAEDLESTRRDLADVLAKLDRPLLVFLDDLDRLETDELRSVLRAVRLTSDLPNLTQVMAYDRNQLALTLFPRDPSGTRARDHIAKIVNREFTIGNPPQELAGRLLDRTLRPFLEALDDKGVSENFIERLREARISVFVDSLPTPREILRVAAATAGRWEQMAGHLNLFDLFVLTILQYRFPVVFRDIRAHSEWFVELSWSQDPYIRIVDSERKRLRKLGKDYVEHLEKGRDEAVAAKLVKILFPNLGAESGLQGETENRRERRIRHPEITARYFHLYVPAHVVSEKEIEEYASQLLAANRGRERQRLLETIIETEFENGRLNSFLDQWSLVFGQHPQVSRHEASLVRDLSLGLALAAHRFSHEASILVGPQDRHAAFKVLFLSFHLDDSETATEILREAIRRATSLSFAGTIVHYAPSTKRPSGYEDSPQADLEALREVMTTKVLDCVTKEPVRLLELPAHYRAAALYSTSDDGRIASVVLEALSLRPLLLPRVLELGAPIRTDESGVVVAADSLDPKELAGRLDLEEINKITAGIPLSSWNVAFERELVERFRDWICSSAREVPDVQ